MREKKNKLRVIKVQNHKANTFRANSRTRLIDSNFVLFTTPQP